MKKNKKKVKLIGLPTKIIVVIAVIFIGLNIFLPQETNKIINIISKEIGIEASGIKSTLDTASNFTKEQVGNASDFSIKQVDNISKYIEENTNKGKYDE
jgi:hypothetical protein